MNRQSPPSPPWLGACYYPELTPEAEWPVEIARMKDIGINAVRMGEFVWSRIEPREGVFDFDWLERIIHLLAENGIAVILCTPSTTAPLWLTETYPEVLMQCDDGTPHQHGARQHTCFSSPVYRRFCATIVAKLGERFGSHPNVVGWQIDNEMHYHVAHITPERLRGCFCPECHKRFHDRLRRIFHNDIESLNDAWCTDIWSQRYTAFSQIPAPRNDTWHHPSLVMEWLNAQSDHIVDFAENQVTELRKWTKAPVGTDMRRLGDVHWEKMHRFLDVVQFNFHPGPEKFRHAPFWYDYCHPWKSRPFWVMEISPFGNGGVVRQPLRDPRFIGASTWLPLAMGAELSMYWHWREHRAGHEIMHGAVVSAQLRDNHGTAMIRQTGDEISAAAFFLRSTRPVPAKIALHMSCEAYHFFTAQPVVEGFKPLREDTDFYQPIVRDHWRVDVIDPAQSLEPYRVVITPYIPNLRESGLHEKIRAWISQGGVWIVGPLTDIRNAHGDRFTAHHFGHLEDWTGAAYRYGYPANPEICRVDWGDAGEHPASVWCDGWQDPEDGQVLARHTTGPLAGAVATFSIPHGKGRIIQLGTVPPEVALQAFLRNVGRHLDIFPEGKGDPNLIIVPRTGAGIKGVVAVETLGQTATLIPDHPWMNLLTSQEGKGRITIPPYGTVVLRYP